MLSPFLDRHSTTHSFNSILKVAEDTAIISLITKVSVEYREEPRSALQEAAPWRTRPHHLQPDSSGRSPHLQVPLSSHHQGSYLGYNKTTNNKTAAVLPQKNNETRGPTGYSAKFTGAISRVSWPAASLPGTLYTCEFGKSCAAHHQTRASNYGGSSTTRSAGEGPLHQSLMSTDHQAQEQLSHSP